MNTTGGGNLVPHGNPSSIGLYPFADPFVLSWGPEDLEGGGVSRWPRVGGGRTGLGGPRLRATKLAGKTGKLARKSAGP